MRRTPSGRRGAARLWPRARQHQHPRRSSASNGGSRRAARWWSCRRRCSAVRSVIGSTRRRQCACITPCRQPSKRAPAGEAEEAARELRPSQALELVARALRAAVEPRLDQRLDDDVMVKKDHQPEGEVGYGPCRRCARRGRPVGGQRGGASNRQPSGGDEGGDSAGVAHFGANCSPEPVHIGYRSATDDIAARAAETDATCRMRGHHRTKELFQIDLPHERGRRMPRRSKASLSG